MTVAKRKIGTLEVHPVGLGCMNLSHAYGPAQEHDDAIAFLRAAIDMGYDLRNKLTVSLFTVCGKEKALDESGWSGL